MSKPYVTVEKWSVVQDVVAQGFEELKPGNRLTGYVLGHANLPNTKLVYTSPIMGVDLDQGIVETHNTMYRLGTASDEYQSWQNKRRAA